MYRTLFTLWLLIPVAVIVWHVGSGRDYLAADFAGIHIRAAEKAEAEKRWSDASDAYTLAAAALSENSAAHRRRLEFARAIDDIKAGQLIEGQLLLGRLIDEMAEDEQSDQQLLVAIRHEYAKAGYHAAWLMRLENADEAVWKQQLGRAQAQFRLLAEGAVRRDENPGYRSGAFVQRESFAYKANLEAAIRLEQISSEELNEVVLPAECPDCKILDQLGANPSTVRDS